LRLFACMVGVEEGEIGMAMLKGAERRLETRRKMRIEKQDAFLKAFVKFGTVAYAVEAAGCSRKSIYNWDHDDQEGFKERFELARHEWREKLERRMIERLEDPEGNRGSDVLLMFALKGAYPEKYKDAVVVTDSSAKDLIARLRVIKPAPAEIEGDFRAIAEGDSR